MARSFTAAQLMARVRYVADCEGDTHVSDAEIYKHLTSAVAETWDKLIAHGLGGEGVKTVTFTTTAGTSAYPIATLVTAGDFYKVKTLLVSDGAGGYRPIKRVTPNEEYGLKAPQSAVAMKLNYIPCAPTFTTGLETFDGINGWEEHTIQRAAIAIKKKKEDDAGQYKADMREVEERMKTHANRNADEPPRVLRRRAAQAWGNKVAPYTGEVLAFDIIGLNIELFAPSYGMFA